MRMVCIRRFIAQEGKVLPGEVFEVSRPLRARQLIGKGLAMEYREAFPVCRTNECVAPREWEGDTVVVIAGGPSLTAADVALVQMMPWRRLVVNDGYRLDPSADMVYACDARWWAAHHEAVAASSVKQGVTRDAGAAKQYGLRHVRSENKPGLSPTPDTIHEGGNSGYQAINLAVNLGASRIVLLGFDMQRGGDGKSHWFGDHPGRMNVPSPYADWIRKFDKLSEDIAARGVAVVNCSRETALTAFERLPLETVISSWNAGTRG